MRKFGCEVKFFKSEKEVPVVFSPTADVYYCGKHIDLIDGTTIINISKYFLTYIIFKLQNS